MTIREIQDEIIDEFSFFDDWQDKYSHIIDLGKELDAYPEEFRDEDHLVKGCQSRVWLHSRLEGGNMHFHGDSDALIPRGLIALLLQVFEGQPAADIANCELDFIEKIGLSTHLSPTRSNGLANMVKKIKALAKARA